jgi:hypothetical protein
MATELVDEALNDEGIRLARIVAIPRNEQGRAMAVVGRTQALEHVDRRDSEPGRDRREPPVVAAWGVLR